MNRSYWFLVLFLITSILHAQPVVNSFSPGAGAIGTSVTITGSNFNASAALNTVFFGAVRASVSAATASSLTVTVPDGATYQPIVVTVNGLTGYSAKPFVVTYSGGSDIAYTTFGHPADLITDLHPNQLVIVDLDGDGRPDLATSNNYSTAGFPASVSILRNTSQTNLPSFAPKSDLVTGVLTYAIAAGDLDGDGRPDLVSSSGLDKTISIFRNTSSPGSISFAAKTDYATGEDPFSIGIGDLDGDGRPDIVVANWLSSTISIFQNTSTGGNILFIKKADIAAASLAENCALGDLDGDGKLDLIVVNDLANSFSVFRNISAPGTISFAPKIDVTTGTDNPFGVAIGDIDGDSKPDLVITNSNYTKTNAATVSMSIFRNTGSAGTISFAPRVDATGTGDAGNPAITDINGDGKPDIIVPNTAGSVSVYQNGSLSGNITFPIRWDFTGFAPNSAASGDLDGDGLPDLALTNFTSNKISLFRNLTRSPHVYAFNPGAGAGGTVVSLTGDNFTGATAVSFGGTPAAAFTVVDSKNISATVADGASGDVSVTNAFGTGSLSGFVYQGPPSITSLSPGSADSGQMVTITGKNFTDVTAVSFGGTNALSFTVVSPFTITAVVGNGSSGTVTVTNAYGSGSIPGYIVAPPSISTFSPPSAGVNDTVTITGTNLGAVTSVYFGGAPALDFVIGSSTRIKAVVAGGVSGAVSVRTARTVSLPGFTFISPAPPVISAFAPSVGLIGSAITISGQHFNPDPAKNIVWFGAVQATVVSATASSLSVLVPAGAGYEPVSVLNMDNGLSGVSESAFVVTQPVPGAIDTNLFDLPIDLPGAFTFPIPLASADLDGDGKIDVVGIYDELVDLGGGLGALHRYASVIRNTSQPGHISFEGAQRFPLTVASGGGGTYALSAVTADLDGDGKKDVIVVDAPPECCNSLGIIRNTSVPGNISFAPVMDYEDLYIDHVFVADMDGDGRPDIVGKGVTNGNNANIYRNTSVVNHISMGPMQKFPVGGDLLGVADLNGDGLADMIMASDFTVYYIQNTSSNGVISFAAPVPVYATVYDHFLTNLSIGDLDGDDRPDIFIINSATAQGSYTVLRNTSANHIASFVKTDYAIDGKPGATAIADVNGDGKPDLITGEYAGGQVSVYANTSAADTVIIGRRQNFPVKYVLPSPLPADIDGDGKMDLIISGPNAGTPQILRNRMGESPGIAISGAVDLCMGGSVTLTSSAATGNQWYKDSTAIAGATGKVLVVTASGTYSVTTLVNGVASAFAKGILVTVNPVPARPVITRDNSNNQLLSSNATGNQWYSDTTSLIAGAVAQAYKPTVSGVYSVKTTANGCSSPFSAVYNFILTAVQDLGNGRFVQASPNPASNFLTITYRLSIFGDLTVGLTDLHGRRVITKTNVKSGENINIAGLAKGIYFLKLYNAKEKVDVNLKILKL